MKTKADSRKLGYVGSIRNPSDSRDSDSWFTPAGILERARKVLGGTIGFDPFSSKTAQEVVRAERYSDSRGFDIEAWKDAKTVFMNPPYSRGKVNLAAEVFLEAYRRSYFESAVVLVNNATDTLWFHKMLDSATAVCFTKGRIAFVSPDGKHVSGNTRGQAVLLFGPAVSAFRSEFGSLGRVLEC